MSLRCSHCGEEISELAMAQVTEEQITSATCDKCYKKFQEAEEAEEKRVSIAEFHATLKELVDQGGYMKAYQETVLMYGELVKWLEKEYPNIHREYLEYLKELDRKEALI